MTDELLLAIDAGTGSCRAVIFTPDGTQLAICQREYTHPAASGSPGLTGVRYRHELAPDLRMHS